MDITEHFEVQAGIGVFRPGALDSVQQSIRVVSDAISHARAAGIAKLLVDATALNGSSSPSIGTRHQMVREWASAAGGVVSVAMVVRREFIDPQKFGVVAAANFGLVSNVFERPDDAMAWLRSLK